MRILGISGSLRAGSYNSLLLDNAAASMENPHRLKIHNLEGIPFYNEDLDNDNRPATGVSERLLWAQRGRLEDRNPLSPVPRFIPSGVPR